MLKRIDIQNFQSHKNTTLEFEPGLNIIIGQSDSGKSAIIRALRWVCMNKPTGDAFRSRWGGDTEVCLTTMEGTVIKRGKTNSENTYHLNDSRFAAFNQDIPDEIIKALDINEINLQKQLDSPYLLSETSGVVATHFNRIAHLDVIDKSLQAIQKEINRLNKVKETAEEEKAKKVQQLEEFVDLEALESDIEKITILNNNKQEISTQVKNLKSIVFNTETIQEQIDKTLPILEAEKAINEILQYYEVKRDYQNQYRALRTFSIAYFEKTEALKELDFIENENKDIEEVLNLWKIRTETAQNQKILQKLYTLFTEKETAQKTALKTLETLEQDFHDNFPEVCPLCNSKKKH